MNTKTLLVVGASVVAVFAAFVLYERSMSDLWDAIFPARSVYTTDMRPIDITLTDPITKNQIHLRIPKAYLTKEENWKGGEQEIIVMQTRLPDMLPALASPPDLQGIPGSPEYESSLKTASSGNLTVALGVQQIANVSLAYDRLKADVYESLILDSRLHPLVDAMDTGLTSGTSSFGGLETLLLQQIASHPQQGMIDLIEFVSAVGATRLGELGWNSNQFLVNALNDAPALSAFNEELSSWDVKFVATPGSSIAGTSRLDLLVGTDSDDTLIDAGDGIWMLAA